MGENIGAAARGMLNFGLKELRLVAPRDGWPSIRAINMGTGAFDQVVVTVYKTLEEALNDCHFALATTARRRDIVKPTYDPITGMEACYKRMGEGQKTALIFGPERTGLENDEISLASGILSFPINPEFPSLNLASAVVLASYLWFEKTQGIKLPEPIEKSPPASGEEMQVFLNRLHHDLRDKGFFLLPEKEPSMWRNLQNIFTRNNLTSQEIRTLHGVLTSLSAANNTKQIVNK